jgi:hypothetical protein
VFVCVLLSPLSANHRPDVVLQWNEIAVNTMLSQPAPGVNPFAQARFMSITQLAVFEAVNAITRRYEPYLGSIHAPFWASPEAAAIAAAHGVLKNYFSTTSGAMLDAARESSLAMLRNGPAKTRGIEVGEAAATAMIQARLNDGSSPPAFYMPESDDPGVWQLTPSCTPAGGAFYQWGDVTPFGIRSVDRFIADPPPSLTSRKYTKDYIEVMTVGGVDSTNRPQDRADVARFYAATSPAALLNSAARQVAVGERRSLAANARALALLNMASNDALVVSFATKYEYTFWRPETAIRAGDTDGNPRTTPDPDFVPFILTPCFPGYGSNHASGTYAGVEVLERLYGPRGHSVTLMNPALPDIVLHYRTFARIGADVDDARVYGGIHFRFDQEAGARLGREVASYVFRRNLQRANGHHWDDD